MSAPSLAGLSIAGPQADQLVIAALGLALAILAYLVCRRSPRIAFAGWLLTVCFVPIWFGISLPFYFSLATLGAALVLTACLPIVSHRLGLADWGIAVLFAASLAPFLIGLTSLASAIVVPQWATAFLLGRLIAYRVPLDAVYRYLSIIVTAAAALAIVEFLLSWNPFVELATSSPLFNRWSPLQERGGIIRAEGAFGHSIALGACLALVIPIALTARFRIGVRLAMVLVLIGGTVVSFSRIGMLCAMLAVALSVLFLRQEFTAQLRVLIASASLLAGLILVPFITSTFDAAGDEASSSAAYRGDLLSLIPAMQPLGLAANLDTTPSGEVYFGGFRSIDSALILFGLTYGWIPLLLIGASILAAIVLTVIRQASPPMVAVVAQLPAVFSVALINQYAIFLWFIVGLAVYSRSELLGESATTLEDSVEHRHSQRTGS